MKHEFKHRVEALVAQIPEGSVMSYGQIAALCSVPRAARVVGGIAHYGDPMLPWHRVVSAQGGLAVGYPGGRATQATHLREEGTIVGSEERVDMDRCRWWPEERLSQGQTGR